MVGNKWWGWWEMGVLHPISLSGMFLIQIISLFQYLWFYTIYRYVFDMSEWVYPLGHVHFVFFNASGVGKPSLLCRSLFLTFRGGFTPLSCPFHIFRRAVVEKPSSSRRVRFFRHAGVGRPSHHVNFVFSTCHGGETLSVTSRSFYSTCRGGETLLVTLISYFWRAVVGKPSPSCHVHFIWHFVVGMSYLPFLTLSVFFCKLLKTRGTRNVVPWPGVREGRVGSEVLKKFTTCSKTGVISLNTGL